MERRVKGEDLQKVVNEELTNAIENGVDFLAKGYTTEQIVMDMSVYCPAVEGLTPEELTPRRGRLADGPPVVTETPPTAEELARFYRFVDKLPNGCHFWAGARSRGKGNRKWYGSFWYRGKMIRAHKFAHDHIGGKVCPPGHHRDHTCEFSLCVNEAHLEAVTHAVNQDRKVNGRQDKTDGGRSERGEAGHETR